MARFFGKKTDQGPDQAQAAGEHNGVSSASDAPKRRKKEQEHLSSVVSESVPQAAVAVLQDNEEFTLADGVSWAILVLNVDDIGGLSKKQRSDEAKGSIVELIQSDRIQALATTEMLGGGEDETLEILGFIPTTSTLERMDEYSLLADAPYFWARVAEGADDETLDVQPYEKATFIDARDVAASRKLLSDVAPVLWEASEKTQQNEQSDSSQEVAEADSAESGPSVESAGSAGSAQSAQSPEAEEPAETEPVIAAEPDEGVDYSDLDADEDDEQDDSAEIPDFDETADEDADFEGVAAQSPVPASAPDTAVQPSAAPADTQPVSAEEEDFAAEADEDFDEYDSYAAYVDENRSRLVEEEEVRAQIVRRFLPEDLDLQIALDEFENTFNTEAPAITFDVAQEPGDWLGAQLSQLTRQANAELEQLHRGHVDSLRELYVETMSMFAEGVDRDVSTLREGTIYHKMVAAADRDLEAAEASVEERRAGRAKELTERFERDMENRRQQAAANAATQYQNRFGPQLEEQLASISPEIQRKDEQTYQHRREVILNRRRQEALRRMDYGVNSTFRMLTERQERLRKLERDAMAAWNDRLTDFLHENRRHDIARMDTLADQLSRDNSLSDLREEHRRETERMSAEYDQRIEKASREIDRIQERSASELSQVESKWKHELDLQKEQTSSASRLAEQLREQMGQLGQTYEDQYQSEITALKADRDSANAGLAQASHIQSRANKILTILFLSVSLGFLLLGLILGWNIGVE